MQINGARLGKRENRGKIRAVRLALAIGSDPGSAKGMGSQKDRKKRFAPRSLPMTAIKSLRVAFYLLATAEMVLLSIVWSGLPIH